MQIHISQPCQENWNEMSSEEKGRFCNQCEKTVVDFSSFSDAALLNYFEQHHNFCGRFKNSQLDRPLYRREKIQLQKRLNFPSRVAAVLLTLLSFKQSQAKTPGAEFEIEKINESAPDKIAGNVEITGKILDDLEKPVPNATIFFDNIKVGESDIKGDYILNIERPTLKSHTISFSKKNYRSTTLSYHPLMGNTTNNIVMWNFATVDCHLGFSMGAPRIASFEDLDYGKIVFDKYDKPNNSSKNALEAFASKLRSNPNANVTVNYFYIGNKQQAFRKGNAIINFMVDQQGIDRGRLKLGLIKNREKSQTIKVINNIEY